MIEEMRAQFTKDVNAKDMVFARTEKFAAEATEEIAGAPAWMGLIN